MRRRYKKRAINDYGKWADQVVQTTLKITEIELQNQIYKDKLKTVFYCAGPSKPEGIMCVAWERTTFNVGDEIDLTGRIKDGVFIVWRHMYKPSKAKD